MALGPPALLWRPAALAALLSLGLAPTAAAQAGLSFEQRVACRERVEDVYWAHRLWPRENNTPKPPRETVTPRSAVARRVEEALRYEGALSAIWGKPLTPEVIQAEIDREARSTRDPAMLRALWAALGNDPYLVAECLVRPELAERRIKEWYASDRALHAATRHRAESELAAATAGRGFESLRAGTGQVATSLWVKQDNGAVQEPAPGAVALASADWERFTEALVTAFPATSTVEQPPRPSGLSGPVQPASGTPAELVQPVRRAMSETPLGQLSPLREEGDRFSVEMVQERSAGSVRLVTVSWPKQGFAEWWQGVRGGFAADLPISGVYSLSAPMSSGCADNTWTIPPTLAFPAPRVLHTAVWTGSEMIVWGGSDGQFLNSGGRYTPGTDS